MHPRKLLTARITGLLLAGLTLVGLGGPARAAELGPEIPAASRGEQCVEPTEVIRRDHMKFLMHKRDETMHRGIRTSKHSLKECVSCHARRDARMEYVRIDAEGEFCDSCHSYAAVSIDCFQCHAAKPAEDGRSAELAPGRPDLSGSPLSFNQ